MHRVWIEQRKARSLGVSQCWKIIAHAAHQTPSPFSSRSTSTTRSTTTKPLHNITTTSAKNRSNRGYTTTTAAQRQEKLKSEQARLVRAARGSYSIPPYRYYGLLVCVQTHGRTSCLVQAGAKRRCLAKF